MSTDAIETIAPVVTDVLIVGAGPVGLFAAFQAGVLGLSCEIVEALDKAGGQCIELYPDKPIFDIPALPVCTARELVERLLEQARPFGAPIHLGQRAETLTHGSETGESRFTVVTDQGMRFDAAAVLIAGGNGAFTPQRLAVDNIAALEGRSIHYAVRQKEALRGKHVAIAGGGDSAVDWALALQDVVASLTLIHRRDHFRAADASVHALREAIAAGRIAVEIGTIAALETTALPQSEGDPYDLLETVLSESGDPATSAAVQTLAPPVLQALLLKQMHGEKRLPVEQLIVLYGLVADLGPLHNWGLSISAGRTDVDTAHYQTSVAGVFAAGDIAGYANKQKLILSGFHEAALALRQAYRLARPEKTRTHIHSSYDPRLTATILGSHENAL